jgi:putative DNA primase/helicase
VKFNDKQRYGGKVYQCLYSLATDDKGELCYLHRRYWMAIKKADIGARAKRQKSLQEETIWIMPVQLLSACSRSPALGIAEGIETALSAQQIYNVNTWATMTADS